MEHQNFGSSDKELGDLYTLPNGMEVYHHNAYETDFVYSEIFEQQIYLRQGIKLPDDAVVVDIGANIGLFVLFVKQQSVNANIFAFEPSPPTVALLKRNTQHLTSVSVFQLGVGKSVHQSTFTYYPGYSILSGFHANEVEDKKILGSGIASQLRHSHPEEEASDRFLELVMGDKLNNGVEYICGITSLSATIDAEAISRIDLLKIDAEKSEFDILLGIEDRHWEMIQQIVMEAHDEHQFLAIEDLLVRRGFKISFEQEKHFDGASIYNIYSRR